MSAEAKPDILKPFSEEVAASDGSARQGPSGRGPAYALVYVRPETNKIVYESEIVKGIRKHADVVYLANLNGRLFLERGILEGHFASQFRFASSPRAELAAFPEIAAAFEAHFGLRPEEARIAGSFAAVIELGLDPDELFSRIVPAEDFLAVHGQTFKKIEGLFVVNYDLPAVIARYGPESNVFVALAREKTEARERAPEGGGLAPEGVGRADFFTALNQSIYDEVVAGPETPIVAGDKLAGLVWSERIRRTYHISTNRLMAMLDMADFVYKDADSRLEPAETPLGRRIVAEGRLDAAALAWLKRRQLCYAADPGGGEAKAEGDGARRLVYLPQAGLGLGDEAAASLLVSCAPGL